MAKFEVFGLEFKSSEDVKWNFISIKLNMLLYRMMSSVPVIDLSFSCLLSSQISS